MKRDVRPKYPQSLAAQKLNQNCISNLTFQMYEKKT